MTNDDSRSLRHPIDDADLDRRLDALTRSTDAPEHSWNVIERRIRKRRWKSALAGGLAAAAVLSGVALVVTQIGSTALPAGGAAKTMQAEIQAMRVAAPDTPLASDIDSPAALMTAWQDNQQAIAQLEQALEQDPGNRLLLEFLTEARMRQARLVRSIGQNQSPNYERSMNL